jgi:hypothetical protein
LKRIYESRRIDHGKDILPIMADHFFGVIACRLLSRKRRIEKESWSIARLTRRPHQYGNDNLLASRRAYKLIPASGQGSSGTNYDQTNTGYDLMKRPNRSATPGGTVAQG